MVTKLYIVLLENVKCHLGFTRKNTFGFLLKDVKETITAPPAYPPTAYKNLPAQSNYHAFLFQQSLLFAAQ